MMPALPMGVQSALPTTPVSRLLALWLAVTVLVCLALGALALLVARQSRALQADRARDTTERMLLAHRDTVAARITSVASWLVQVGASRASASAPDWTRGREVLVLVSGASGASSVHGTWLFTPDGGDGLDPIEEFFELEQAELADPTRFPPRRDAGGQSRLGEGTGWRRPVRICVGSASWPRE